MEVLKVRNVHQALPTGIRHLLSHGYIRDSRNGPVLLSPVPVATVYSHPNERVLFWPERDANPFFHLYESLWMLAGRQDVEPLARYAKNMLSYSDDGVIQHGAYGYRWRNMFNIDQLAAIANRLRVDPDDRRSVLQMWSAALDLGQPKKDVPCNVTATFQRNASGALDLTVFCRSNDIIWGAYGANAVHFSMLLEYMALWIGCPVGTYTQVSVNYHAYLSTLEPLKELPEEAFSHIYAVPTKCPNPYTDAAELDVTINGDEGRHYIAGAPAVRAIRMYHGSDIKDFNRRIHRLLFLADNGFSFEDEWNDDEPFFEAARRVLKAHQLWKTLPAPHRYTEALRELDRADRSCDWVEAAKQWLRRRQLKWESEQ